MKKLFYLLLMLPLMLAACAEMPTTEIEPQPTPTPEPEPTPVPETFNPVHVEAYRAQDWDLGRFVLVLYINDELYHTLDMRDIYNPNDGYLTEGDYTMENGGVTSWSNIIWDFEANEDAYIAAAELSITHHEDGTTNLKGFLESEYGHHLDIDWSGIVAGFVFGGTTPEPPAPNDDMVFNAPYFGCKYISPEDNGVNGHNYWVILSDDATLDTNTPTPGATYFAFDLFAATKEATLPHGTYTFDTSDTGEPNTLGYNYSYGVAISETCEPQELFRFSEGAVTVTEGKIVAELTREDNGGRVTVTYEGDLSVEIVEEEEVFLSTLTSDIEFNKENVTLYAECYDDWYSSDTDNWWITIYEDGTTLSGLYLQLDLLGDISADDYQGVYTPIGSVAEKMTYAPGYIEDGYLASSWYAELNNGSITNTMAPLVSGDITIAINADGSITVTLDCRDDAGNYISGTATALP